MKLQVTQANLNRGLSSVARVASSRGTLPILANVLIKTSKNRLSLSATNLDIAITQFIGAKITEEGSVTVPAKLMQEFINSLPEEIIDLETEGNKLKVSTDKYNSVVNGIAADDFPVMPAIKKEKSWDISLSLFKKALNQVVFAASSDETRPVLTGVLIKSINKKLYLAATDSYRLAEKQIATINEDIEMLIPASALQDLIRVMDDNDTKLTIKNDGQQVLFQTEDIELVSRQVDGQYPDYAQLIPTNFTTTAKLKRSDFINITKVSSLFARESAGSITIVLDEENQTININSVASQLGENTASAEAKITGAGEITLNSRYLLDALNVFTGEEIEFCFNGKLEPSLLRDPKQKDYKHIIMPLKS
jgi:DNA polymerase-3 subunit beta